MNIFYSALETISGVLLQAICIFIFGMALRRLTDGQILRQLSNKQLAKLSLLIAFFLVAFQLVTAALNPIASFFEMKSYVVGLSPSPNQSDLANPAITTDTSNPPTSPPPLRPGEIMPGQAAPPDVLKNKTTNLQSSVT